MNIFALLLFQLDMFLLEACKGVAQKKSANCVITSFSLPRQKYNFDSSSFLAEKR